MDLGSNNCSSRNTCKREEDLGFSDNGSSSGETESTGIACIDHLVDDLLLHIFVLIPSKSVYQLRCVSKRWLSLLSDSTMNSPSFIGIMQRPFSTLLFASEWRKKYWEAQQIDSSESVLGHKFCLDFMPKSLVAVTSYNDLILFQPYHDRHSFYLCNIFTKQWIPIPHPSQERVFDDVKYVMGLLPDRVVCLCSLKDRCILNASVFKFCDGNWIGSRSLEFLSLYSKCSKGLPCNGKLYWLISLREAGGVLVYYPSKNDSDWGLIEYPNDNSNYDVIDISKRQTFWFIGECLGKVRLSNISRDRASPWTPIHDKLELWIWELEDDADSYWEINNIWCLKHKEYLLDFVFEDDGLTFLEKHNFDHPGRNRALVKGFHPYDRDIIYLEFHFKILICNLRRRTLRYTVSHFQDGNLFVLPHLLCPTPLPNV